MDSSGTAATGDELKILCRVEQLTHVYERHRRGSRVATRAINDVSFSLHEGERLVFMGKSGSGKSTLLHLMGGLDRPKAGRILYPRKLFGDTENGEVLVDVAKQSERALDFFRGNKVGFIFQAFHLVQHMTCLENVASPLLFQEWRKRDRNLNAQKWLERVGMDLRMDHYPSELSGGEQQRVAIARAMVHRPQVLIADEPTGNLDTSSATQVAGLLRNLSQTEGVALVVATHDPALPGILAANRVLHLSDGTLEKSEAKQDYAVEPMKRVR